MPMPFYLRIVKDHFNRAKKFFLQGKWVDAIQVYESLLEHLDDAKMKSDMAMRSKAHTSFTLAVAIIEFHNDTIQSVELADKIIQLYTRALFWYNKINNKHKSDHFNYTDINFRLALIYFGKGPLASQISKKYFKETEAAYYIYKIGDKLDSVKAINILGMSSLKIKFPDFLHDYLNYLIAKYDVINNNDEQSDDKDLELDEIADVAEYCCLTGLEYLDSLSENERDDNYWRLRVRYYKAAMIVSEMKNSDKDYDYALLVFEHFPKINNITTEDIKFLNKIYDDWRQEPSDLNADTVKQNIDMLIDVEIARITILIELLKNRQLQENHMDVLFKSIYKGFKLIYQSFLQCYAVDSYEVKIANYARECFRGLKIDPNQNFKPEHIIEINEIVYKQCLSDPDNKALDIHKLCLYSVLSLYNRPYYPNIQLSFYLSDQNNLLLFKNAFLILNSVTSQNRSDDISADNLTHQSDASLDSPLDSADELSNSSNVMSELSSDLGKKTAEFSLGLNRHIFMPGLPQNPKNPRIMPEEVICEQQLGSEISYIKVNK